MHSLARSLTGAVGLSSTESTVAGVCSSFARLALEAASSDGKGGREGWRERGREGGRVGGRVGGSGGKGERVKVRVGWNHGRSWSVSDMVE